MGHQRRQRHCPGRLQGHERHPQFADGVGTNSFTVKVIDDSLAEDDETINLSLFNVTGGATLGLSNAVITIVDNDSPNGRVNSVLRRIPRTKMAQRRQSLSIVRAAAKARWQLILQPAMGRRYQERITLV